MISYRGKILRRPSYAAAVLSKQANVGHVCAEVLFIYIEATKLQETEKRFPVV